MSEPVNVLTVRSPDGGPGVAAPAPAVDDMEDTPEELERWPELREPLQLCREELLGPYRGADRAALGHQRLHRWVAIVAAVCGTAAVLLAILQLAAPTHVRLLPEIELLAAGAAVIAVILGLVASSQTQWLLQRHKAERCRLLKFRFLSDPGLWAGDAAARQERVEALRTEVREIAGLTTHDLHRWVQEDEIPELPSGPLLGRAPASLCRPLVEYFQAKRLGVQIAYFARQVQRNVRLDERLRHWPAAFFFVSVLAALGHFVFDIFAGAHGHPVSVVLIVLAAGLPVLGTGVRTIRMSYEFARNTIRFRAKLVVLRRLSETLGKETLAEAVFRELWCGEQVLESEHREWLRLMAEAEWFG